ncbi:hypothetical protein DL98DRAFT_210357 [Cadophora sp. DSE1049]|nr:hypothetical protein DL98DRAFT_210357 [Cadophora sp. DSE1049]
MAYVCINQTNHLSRFRGHLSSLGYLSNHTAAPLACTRCIRPYRYRSCTHLSAERYSEPFFPHQGFRERCLGREEDGESGWFWSPAPCPFGQTNVPSIISCAVRVRMVVVVRANCGCRPVSLLHDLETIRPRIARFVLELSALITPFLLV